MSVIAINRQLVRAGPLIAFGVFSGVASVQPPIAGPPDFFQLLQTRVGVSDRDLSVTLPAAQALAMLLPVHEKGEVAVAAVERVRVPLEFFLNAFRKTPIFNRGQQLLVVHEFNDPPDQQDLQSVNLQPEEIQALDGCSPGHCSVKLCAPMMEQFRGKAAAPGAVERRFRDLILRYLYLEKGNPAMITYADELPPVQSSQQFNGLLQEVDWLRETAPPLYSCLESFSGNACPQIESFVYWSSAKFGFKPVFSITHRMIYRTVKAGQPWVFVAFKQIYADHYFNGSLGLAVLVEQSADPTDPALWILYLNRSRTEVLQGWLGPPRRPPENRPYVATSKPANGTAPGQEYL